jgi:hypothetical protein
MPKNILELLWPFGLLPIEILSCNLLETNIPKRDSIEFTMLTFMDGNIRTSTDAAIRRDGLWLSSRLPIIISLAASQELNGSLHLTLSQIPPHSCSVWIKAENTLSLMEKKRLFNVTTIKVLCLGLVAMKYQSFLNQIFAMTIPVTQTEIVSSCQQPKVRSILQWMEGWSASN